MSQDYRGVNMKNKSFIFLLVLFLIPLRVDAFPQYLDIFNKDKFARPEKKNSCGVCHNSPSGGGPVNDFGQAFDANGFKITNNLRQKFPELFDLMKALEPKIIRIKPSIITASQETKLLILGSNFASDSTVKIDGKEAKDFSGSTVTFVSSKRIDLTITFTDVGIHTIQVINVTGQASKTFRIRVKPPKV